MKDPDAGDPLDPGRGMVPVTRYERLAPLPRKSSAESSPRPILERYIRKVLLSNDLQIDWLP